MNYELYDDIVGFLQSEGQDLRQYPASFALLPLATRTSKKANFRKRCKAFIVEDGRLWKMQPRKIQRVDPQTGQVVLVPELMKVEVVREEELKEVLEQYHGSYHVGRDPMLEALGQDVWWPGMRGSVDNWIQSCTSCQQRTKSTWKTPLRPIIVTKPMQRWQMDFTGPYVYLVSKGGEMKEVKKMCLLLVDCCSKMLWGDLFSSKKCERVARFVELKFKEEGPPEIMQADNAGEFAGPELREVYERYNVKGKNN